MINYRIGICNPDNSFSSQLIRQIKLYAKLNHITFEIQHFCSNQDFLKDYKLHSFHMLFLSLNQESLHGFEIARALRKIQQDIPIIFTSNDGRHALEAFDVYANGYLLKSFKKQQLHDILKKNLTLLNIHAKQEQITKRFVSIETANGWVQLHYTDILYISKHKNKVVFYTIGGAFHVYTSLKEVMKHFHNQDFHYINQSQIINWKHVDNICKNYILIGGNLLKPSRSNVSKINQRIEQDWQKALDEKIKI